jgi:hypothetical protein
MAVVELVQLQLTAQHLELPTLAAEVAAHPTTQPTHLATAALAWSSSATPAPLNCWLVAL